jgi:CRISPR-associated endonuclease Cas1
MSPVKRLNAPQSRGSDAVLILDGYGLRIAVERGHLLVEDGLAAERRQLRFSRLDRALKRILILGHAGTISLDAIRWLNGVGVPLTHLDSDGRVFFVAAPTGAVIPALRRNQAMATATGLAGRISEELIRRKVEGQRQLLPRLPGRAEAEPMLQEVLERLGETKSLKDLRVLEAVAARAYWGAWQPLEVRFVKADARRRPAHWRSFGTRVSPLTTSPRKAVNPANAMLNYLYALLEAEARIAALAVGADPMLGLMHTDARNRDSLVFDLMEPVRPAVDACLLDLLESREFTKDTFFEGLDGGCRLLPPLTTELATTTKQWARLVLPIAQQVAATLLEADRPDKAPQGLMTKDGRRSTKHPVGGRGVSTRPRRGQRPVGREFSKGDVPDRTRQRGPEAGAKRRSAMKEVWRADRAWNRKHPGAPDMTYYREEVMPAMQGVKLTDLVAQTGLTKSACSRIRSGEVVPHARHWEALREAAGGVS